MYLAEAVDVARERLLRHRLSGRNSLWATILKQIAEKDSFDGQHADLTPGPGRPRLLSGRICPRHRGCHDSAPFHPERPKHINRTLLAEWHLRSHSCAGISLRVTSPAQ